jgi:hypothetical protein
LGYTRAFEVARSYATESRPGLTANHASLNQLFDSSMTRLQSTAKARSRLRPYPVPEPLRDHTAYRVLRRGTRWKQIRQDFLLAAGHRCATCRACRRILSCHGKWTYDDRLSTATLTSFTILCADCAIATNIAQAIRRGFGDLAVRQLSRVNGVSFAAAEALAREAMATWRERNKKSWRLYVAPNLLYRYPQLRELSSSQREKLQFSRKMYRSSLSGTPVA